jgi:hypothetical protein
VKRLAQTLVPLLFVVLLGCTQSDAEERQPAPADPSSREMVDRLTALSLEQGSNADLVSTPAFAVNQPYLIPQLEARIAASNDAMQALTLRAELAKQLLMSGASDKALAEAESLAGEMTRVEFLSEDQKKRALFDLQGLIALAALRLGEQENCIARHGRHSCLFPIDQGDRHELRRGSERARTALQLQLEFEPADLTARWLLNLAQMTLGSYPEGLTGRLLMPPGLFRSEGQVERFVDIAPGLGIAAIGLAGGSVLEDLNGDGLLDLAVSSWGLRDQLRYFQNTGTGFAERTREAGILGLVGGINLTHADYDNDGDADLYVLRGGWLADLGEHPDSLLRNNGDGTFSDVTRTAGLLSLHPSHSAAWGDFNNDGWLDLFVAHEERPDGKAHPSWLYASNRDGTFSRYAEFAEMGVVKGVAWGDYDNDGWPDLFLSRFGRSNVLYRNDSVLDREGRSVPGLRRFIDVAAEAGVVEPRLSFPTWFFDYDNDGWLDLFVAAWDGSEIGEIAAQYLGIPNEADVPRLFRNNGDGTFEDVTVATRLDRVSLVMGANYGDLDYDGFLDLYLGTGAPDLRSLMPNRMFRNAGGKRFEDVTTAGGFGHLQKGHGISFGDVDNDGDQDVHAVMGGWFSGDGYQNVLFDNPGRRDRHAAVIRLHGVTSNRSGLGARLRLNVIEGATARTIHRTVSTGGSFGSSPLRQEIGLGSADRIAELRVVWPASGREQTFTNLPAGRLLVVREDRDEVEVRDLPQATFSATHMP